MNVFLPGKIMSQYQVSIHPVSIEINDRLCYRNALGAHSVPFIISFMYIAFNCFIQLAQYFPFQWTTWTYHVVPER